MNNKILEKLLYEFSHHIRNELYSMCQFKLAARSNQIEGNTMTEDDIAMLFDTQQIPSTKYQAKEIEEAQGHFLMFNEMLKSVHDNLSIDLFKSYHREMTQGIFEYKANGGVPGEFKTRVNIAGTSDTVEPKYVVEELNKMIDVYNDIKVKDSILALSYLHARYEHIHPFQDYNGRTGRMILFKESLLIDRPIVIYNEDKKIYIDALKNAHDNNESEESLKPLMEISKRWQDRFYEEIRKFLS